MDYLRYQLFFTSTVTDFVILAGDAGATVVLITPRTAYDSLYIQRVAVYPTTYAAVLLTFQDSASTPLKIGQLSIPATAPTVASDHLLDFGPTGTKLTAGKTFDVLTGATGLACRIHIEAYEKRTVTAAA
jgi:hypothetical protein